MKNDDAKLQIIIGGTGLLIFTLFEDILIEIPIVGYFTLVATLFALAMLIDGIMQYFRRS